MFLLKLLVRLTGFTLFWGALLAAAAFIYIYATFGRDLPTVAFMKDYAPPTVTRFHAADGQVIAEHSVEKRLFVPFDALPEHVVGAFLSAEDKDFFHHSGIDYVSLAGAMINNVQRFREGRQFVGASTITQQVAKNFLTGGERSIERKIREALIAWRLESEFTKEEIFELYVNEVEFGQRAFGIAAAALTYFNRSVKELTVPQAAYLAAILKGPNNYHPVRHHERAIGRRDWVLGQMRRNGYIASDVDALLAKSESLVPDWDYQADILNAPYFAAELKRQMVKDYGEQTVMEDGLSVRSTLDPTVQDMAERNLQKGLIRYDRRHGWRGAMGVISLYAEDWQKQLADFDKNKGLQNSVGDWRAALVYEIKGDRALILFSDGSDGFIPLSTMKWARPWLEDQKVGKSVKRVTDVLALGDVVAVAPESVADASYSLQQIPDVQGAVVVLDPHTGRVQALVGGYNHASSQFNRATQAKRQPGSTFKPFVYLAGLDQGLTPHSKLMDTPVIVRMDNGEIYKPKNADGRFMGEQPLKVGLEQSRNLMTLRLAQDVGMEKITEYARDFGVDDAMRPLLSMALGSGGTSLMNMVGAYAMLANGGKRVRPTLIDRVQDRRGKTIRRLNVAACATCQSTELMLGERLPVLQDQRPQVGDPNNIFHIVSMLQGVVQNGTAKAIGKTLDRPVAGKTGTTNKNHDAWFIGFTPNLVIGVWVGFDKPRTLGKSEFGGRAAAPIFRDLLKEILVDTPPEVFVQPKGFVDKYSDPISGTIRDEDLVIAANQAEQDRSDTKRVRKINPDGSSFLKASATSQSTGTYDPYAITNLSGQSSGISVQPIQRSFQDGVNQESSGSNASGLEGIY